MDVSSIVMGGLLAVAKLPIGSLIWTVRKLSDRIDKEATQRQELEVKVAEEYAKKDELSKALERIEKKLDRLFDDIHRKN